VNVALQQRAIRRAAELSLPDTASSGPEPLDADKAQNLVRLFKLLSDATRLQILNYLRERDEYHVRALCDLLGQSQPAVSHHLALMRAAGLIEARRDGKHNYYRLHRTVLRDFLDRVFASAPEAQRPLREAL
jgi:ArsR family transcriptional regulator